MKSSQLKAVLDYLLTVQLNLNFDPEVGDASNKRLRGLFMSLLETIRPQAFFDIGSRDGESAIAVKNLIPECRAFAFEANPKIFSQFAAKNAADGLIQYQNLAISNINGFIDLHVPRTSSEVVIGDEIVQMHHVEAEDTGRSSILKRSDPNATYDNHKVPTRTLDQVCKETRAASLDPIALWIDVEGAATQVLAGAKKTLSKAAIVFIEVEGHAFWDAQAQSHTVIERLVDLGFVPIARDREYFDKQFNVLLLRCDYLHLAVPHLYSAKSDLAQAKSSTRQFADISRRLGQLESANNQLVKRQAKNFVPIIIPTFNNPTFLRGMIEQLQARQCTNIEVIDNGSTYPPMLDYLGHLEKRRVKVTYMADNAGPRRVWTDPDFFNSLPQVFCVTDPDLRFQEAMPIDFIEQLYELSEKRRCGKVGLALDISCPETLLQREFLIGSEYYTIWDWEKRFWSVEVEPGVYDAPIDTTFALYNKSYFDRGRPDQALRVSGAFTCKHLPWLREFSLPADEADFYQKTNAHSFYMPNTHLGPPTSGFRSQ